MTGLFPKLYFDTTSFWAGVILVALLIVLILRFRKRMQAFFSRVLRNLINFRESLSVSSDDDYIQVLFKYTQGLHITAGFTPLDTILVPPTCIAPPPVFYPDKTGRDTSLVQQTLGYDPLLPELASEFFSPRFSLTEAVREGTDLCLVGQPGLGKTTAVAACMADLVRDRSQEDQAYTRIPFYIKAHHLLAQFPDSNTLGVLIKAIQSNPAFQAFPNFPKYLTSAIKSSSAVIFIDGLDLLTFSDVNRISNFISALKRSIPELQVVACASPTCLGNLITSRLEFISIAPWGDREKYSFLDKLSRCWNAPIPGAPLQEAEEHSIRHAMLVVSDRFSTPLEFTLKALAAYGGDLTGPKSHQAIAAHLQRILVGDDDLSKALDLLALYLIHNRTSSLTKRDINAWIADVYQRQITGKLDLKLPAFSVIIQSGLDSGVLESAAADDYYFASPTLAGYLAARGLSKLTPSAVLTILESPDWGMLHETMRFFPVFGDLRPYLTHLLKDQSLMRDRMLRASLWLSETSLNSPVEMALLKTLTQEINSNPLYLIKLRLVFALARCENPAVKSIFQHLIKSPSPSTRRAAAIGAGLIRDLSAVPLLITQLNDEFPSNTAACYALGRIGSPRSLEAIAEALLHGTELLRRAAAESLAYNRSEGHPALREGATRDDLLVRYAVVHGLSQIPESWSVEILDRMRIDEKEWVVRDLAQQTHELLTGGSPYLPQQIPQPQNAPWLHEFAASQDLPEPRVENALEYLLKALEGGSADQKQFSLAYLSRCGNPAHVPSLLKAASSSRLDIACQAELAAWYLAPARYSFQDPPAVS